MARAVGEQVPTEPVRLQAAQASPHAVLQHTPSAQRPETQSAPVAHGSPFGLTPTHALFLHTAGEAQSAAVAHEVGHPAPMPLQT